MNVAAELGIQETQLTALIDMHTRKVVGWSMRETLHASIALEAVNMALNPSAPHPVSSSIRTAGSNMQRTTTARSWPLQG
jgi:transposase InsO family protein